MMSLRINPHCHSFIIFYRKTSNIAMKLHPKFSEKSELSTAVLFVTLKGFWLDLRLIPSI